MPCFATHGLLTDCCEGLHISVAHLCAEILVFDNALPDGHSLCRCAQERAYVTGLTAANLVVDLLGQGQAAAILPGAPTSYVWCDWYCRMRASRVHTLPPFLV